MSRSGDPAWRSVGGATAVLASLWLGRRRSSSERRAGNEETASVILSVACWGLVVAGSYLCISALGRMKIGSSSSSEKMGVSCDGVGGDDAKKKGTRRRLGLLERWYVAHSRAGMHTGFVVAMELNCKRSSTSAQGQLRATLRKVSAQFPWLRCKVGRDGVEGVDRRTSLMPESGTTSSTGAAKTQQQVWGDDLYVTVEGEESQYQPALRNVTLTDDSSSPESLGGLQQVLEEESIREWHDEDSSQPIWRVTLVRWKGNPSKLALVLAFHHLVTDGAGAMEVARAIVEAMNGDDGGGGSGDYTDKSACQVLPPPMEDVMDTTPTLNHLVRLLFWHSFPTLRRWFHPAHWRGNPVHNTSTQRATELVCCPSLVENVDALREKYCTPKKISLNSVLVATLVQAITKAVTPADSSSLRFKVQLAVDERRRCVKQVPARRLGSYVTGPQFSLAGDGSRSCDDVAREYRKKLKAALEVSAMDIGMCRFIDEDWIEFASKYADEKPNGVHDSLEISLLNDVQEFPTPNENDAEFTVERLWFMQGRRGFGPAIIVTTTNTRSCLNASLSSFPDAVSKEQLLQITSAWKKELKSLES